MHGVIVADKPGGPTSHDVVARIRRFIRPLKAGHTGTLDPMATGVLPVCTGAATRLARFLGRGPKEYTGRIALGAATDTYDAQGTVVEERPLAGVDADRIRAEAAALTGVILQAPPVWSAKRIGGRRSYSLAREGRAEGPAAVEVSVDLFETSEMEGAEVSFRVVCSPGTYIRSLAHELGAKLGCGAHLATLRRTRSGPFGCETAIPLAEIEEAGRRGALAAMILPLEELDLGMGTVRLTEEGVRLAGHGRAVPVDQVLGGIPSGAGESVRLLGPSGRLTAIAEVAGTAGSLIPRVVLPPRES